MTLLYDLYNVPRTLEEFADRAEKEGHKQVNISITLRGNAFQEPHLAVLQAGNCRFIYDPRIPVNAEAYSGSRRELSGIKDALQASKKLKELGLEVLFEGSDAEEILEKRMKKIIPSELIQVVNRILKNKHVHGAP